MPAPEQHAGRPPAGLPDRPFEASAGDPPRPSAASVDDPRLDTAHWRVFGRRLPRRWSFYFRVVAALLLLLAMLWWFTRDVTYVQNVKVSGLETVAAGYEGPLREVAQEFAAVVNWLADREYAWQSGGLPALRAGSALSDAETAQFVSVATVEVRGGSGSLSVRGEGATDEGATGEELAGFLSERGWTLGEGGLEGATRTFGELTARVVVAQEGGREQFRIEVRAGS